MPLAAGTKLGPYEILSPIGAGGMGEVWKARDTRLDRIVAIKVSNEQFSERFEHEARAVAALNHPHICQLYDIGPDYLVMEMVEGAPLRGPLPIEKAVDYAAQILDALDAAHQKGIIHRDLKPANILVTKQGIKLLDFGLAKQKGALAESDETLTRAMTQRGEILGTLQYMSPEQLQGKETDTRSDLFSFGCVLYEMLTGKRAFEGSSAASVIAAILDREPAPLGPEGAPALPLERIVRRSLAKDPEQRFQTARDLKAALVWAMEQPAPAAAVKPVRRWRWIAAAALVIGISLGGWAVSHFRQTPADERSLRLQITPPEGGRFAFGNSVGGIALSPDGRTAAFVASGNGKNGLWVRPLDGTAARLLPGTEGAAYPFWSPDGKSIAFFTAVKLRRVELMGGSPLAICDAFAARGGAWSSDGQIVFGRSTSGLFRVPASGGTPLPLTTLDAGEVSHRWPQVLPGGRFLYWVRSDKEENTGIYVSSLAKPAERVRLATTDSNALYAPGNDGKSYLLWQRGGTLFAQEVNADTLKLAGEPHFVADPVATVGITGQMNAAVSASGLLLYSASNTSSQFTWLDRRGEPLSVLGEPGQYDAYRLSPDGHRVAVSRAMTGNSDLWLLEVERGVSSRFTSNSGNNNFPVWSPDGRTIMYTRFGSGNLFRKDSSGAGSEQRVTQSPNIQDATDWSRDGRFILYFETDPHTLRDLWILDVTPDGRLAANAEPKPYLRTPFNEGWGRFSPEAPPRWVAYQSDETGRYEIYVRAFPEPHGATRVSTGGGQYPQWGPQVGAAGRELFYLSPDYKLMAVSLKLGAGSVKPSAPQELFPLPADDIGWPPYDTAPDGKRFLVRATPQQAAQPLTVIVNWPALLKKGAGAQ
jgi:Tol biopolymer transport system component/predicted Ser/Thr protein kinase